MSDDLDVRAMLAESAGRLFADHVDAKVLDAAFVAGRIEPLGVSATPKPKPPTVRRNGSVAMGWEVAQPGRYVLEASTDLETWTVLTVWNVIAAGTLEYDDPNPGAWTNRFFRVR